MTLEFTPQNVAQYRRSALQAARRTRLDFNSAEDVAQETVIRLFQNRDKLGSDLAVGSWLATTATRIAVRRLSARFRLAPLYETAADSCSEDEIVDRIDKERALELIDQVMASLPSGQRNVLKAIDFDGLSYREVSERLGLAIGSIGPAHGRALKRLALECSSRPGLVA